MRMSPIEEAIVAQLDKIGRVVMISPVFFPGRFGWAGEKTAAGNIVYNNRDFTFIKTYPGAGWTKDVVLALAKTKCQHVVFVGTAGSLSNKYRIGDIVIACGNSYITSLNSLLEGTNKTFTRLKDRGCQLVDLETKDFFLACAKIKRQGIALLLVQDEPLKKPFYRPLTKSDKKRLEKGLNYLVTICKKLPQSL